MKTSTAQSLPGSSPVLPRHPSVLNRRRGSTAGRLRAPRTRPAVLPDPPAKGPPVPSAPSTSAARGGTGLAAEEAGAQGGTGSRTGWERRAPGAPPVKPALLGGLEKWGRERGERRRKSLEMHVPSVQRRRERGCSLCSREPLGGDEINPLTAGSSSEKNSPSFLLFMTPRISCARQKLRLQQGWLRGPALPPTSEQRPGTSPRPSLRWRGGHGPGYSGSGARERKTFSCSR